MKPRSQPAAKDPRLGVRPRVTPGSPGAIDIGEVSVRPVQLGFQPEPPEVPGDVAALGTPRDHDYRANAANPPPAPAMARNLRTGR
jgi:hypothetical protein